MRLPFPLEPPVTNIRPLEKRSDQVHGYHLYVVRVPQRDTVFETLRDQKIGVNIHYIPVHLHPWYRDNLKTQVGLCPVAEEAYGEILSLPIYLIMTDDQVKVFFAVLKKAITSLFEYK